MTSHRDHENNTEKKKSNKIASFCQGEHMGPRFCENDDNFQTSVLLMLVICRVGATIVENIIVTRNVIS